MIGSVGSVGSGNRFRYRFRKSVPGSTRPLRGGTDGTDAVRFPGGVQS
jgi:hypothetical protein